MRAVALLLTITTMLGCFPHNAQHRTYAKWAEGGAIVAGIAMEAVINSGADCDQMALPGQTTGGCHTKAAVLGDLGLALMLGGLLGFIATISTAEEDKTPPPVDIKAEQPADKPKVSLPPGVKAPADSAPEPSGSAAPVHAAP